MITAIIFDLDGTLADTFEDIACAANHALRKMGLPPHPTEFVKTKVGHGLKNLMSDLLEEASQEDLNRSIEYVREFYEEHPTVHTHLYPGVLETLDQLAQMGIRRCILSNKVDSLVQKIGENLDLSPRMEEIWGHREGFPLKPDPDSLHAILKKLALPPDQALFVGDADPDCQLAQNAGVAFCGVSYGMSDHDHWIEAGVPWIIDSFPDLLGVVKAMNGEAELAPEGHTRR